MMRYVPLSERMRPQSLVEIVGQDHLVGEKGYLTQLIIHGRPLSLLLFGPPGCGKTTIARLYAASFKLPFYSMSAVNGSLVEVKKLLTQERTLFFQPLVLFIDELHRFNKAQQDFFLPFLEDGSCILVGATTENPSFAINNALLSRLRVLTLHSLDAKALEKILTRAEKCINDLSFTEEARAYLIHQSQGDGRHLLNLIENIETQKERTIDLSALTQILQKKPALYDSAGEGHYNLISALHKSVRGSDPDAAIYWFCRMIEAGECPLFLARRLIRMAVEDIGLADPQALGIAIHAQEAYQRLGSPEGELALAEAAIYLALAPKSIAAYQAYEEGRAVAAQTGHLNPPKHILNAPTKWMKEEGYGKNYLYDPSTPTGFSGQNYFPDEMKRSLFYRPIDRGFERELKKRVEIFSRLRTKSESS